MPIEKLFIQLNNWIRGVTFPPFLKFVRSASYASPISSLNKRLNKSFLLILTFVILSKKCHHKPNHYDVIFSLCTDILEIFFRILRKLRS